MPGKVFRFVLAFAERKIGGLAKNIHAVAASVLAVSVDVFDANEDRGFQRDIAIGLNQYDGAVADVQLCAVITDSEAEREAERVAEASDGFPNIRIGELWKHGAAGDGAIRQHNGNSKPMRRL